ncbi:MAG: hypothetical protein AAGA70_07400 [Pseudomonadota bacterium]
MRNFRCFISDERGRTSGIAMYLIVLGLFFMAVTAMTPTDGARTIASNGTNTINIQAPRWLRDFVGGAGLPQIGPLTRDR